MFNQSSSNSFSPRAAAKALFLVAAFVFQSFSLPTRGTAFLKTDSEKKIAPDSTAKAQPILPDANVFLPTAPEPQKPDAPQSAVIVATLTDNITAATKVAPGANINYTATIANNGAVVGTDDATNLNFSAPLDANTTLVPNSIHASPIARNETYNWVGNTVLDTSARALPAVTANDILVNAPGGTDTFNVTTIAGGATALGGSVTLLATGHYTYTPPLNRPTLADGASVNDSFTYTISNSADPTLTSTGTVTITLTGRVFYLQAGAAGDGRSNTPSGNPATMSTNADKSTDIFYIFSNAGSLSGLFTVEAGQQLLGQGVALIINIPVLGSTTLFPAQAPTPAINNGAGNCVTLSGAPGNNTLSGFNIGTCSALAIQGANVGALAVSTLSINNTTGGGLNLTGVGTPTVNIVLGGLTATGGTTGATLNGMNGTITLAGGTLSGASGSEFAVNGGGATISYTGGITQNNAQRVVDIQNTTANSVTLSGTLTGGASSTGVNLNADNGNVTFTTLNLGTSGSRMTNQALTINGGTGTYGLGTVAIFTSNAEGIAATNADGTLNSTTGTVDAANRKAINIDGPAGLTTLGMTLTKVASTSSTSNGIFIQDTNGSFTVAGDGGGSSNGSGGTITGATNEGVSLNTVSNISLGYMNITSNGDSGIKGISVTNFTLNRSNVTSNGNSTGNGTTIDDDGIQFGVVSGNAVGVTGNATITNCDVSSNAHNNVHFRSTSGTLTLLTVTNSTFNTLNDTFGANSFLYEASGTSATTEASITGCTFNNNSPQRALEVQTHDTATIGNTGTSKYFVVSGGTFQHNGIHASFTQDLSSNLAFKLLNSNLLFTETPSLGGLQAINIFSSSQATGGTIVGTVSGNTIGDPAIAGSGSQAGSGIEGVIQGQTDVTLLIDGNTIRRTPDHRGISIAFRGPANPLAGTLGPNSVVSDLTLTNNNVDPGPAPSGFPLSAINVEADNQSGADNKSPTVRADIRGNTVPAGAAFDLTSGNLQFYEYDPAGGHGIGQLVDNAPASANADAELSSHNTGSVGSFGIALIAGPINVPPIPNPADDSVRIRVIDPEELFVKPTFAAARRDTALDVLTGLLNNIPAPSQPPNELLATTEKPVVASVVPASTSYRAAIGSVMHHAIGTVAGVAQKLDSIITPTAYAQDSTPNAPTSGENVTLNTIATFPAGGKSITIKYSATVNTPPLARQVQTQGTVTANAGAISVLTDDPEPAGGPQATVTLVDTLLTWNGATNTDWNTITNWTQPAGGTQYAPGVSNPAVNDVVIPNVGAQPNISATDIGVFSLNISNGRTLTITSPRILTIGGSPGGDLTLDGIISGGNLNLGTGTHVVNNAGGTGSLSSTNVATVLSGGTVTLNNNLQAGALAVNAGGSMNITNRTLSLNGSGAALTIPGGATFTTTGSTVVYNGTAAQQAAGIAYNSLTINNSIGAHVTGVTLTGNASVGGVLTLTSSDLATTGAFTLTMPAAATSGPASGATDVVGNVKRTGFVSGGGALSFGNPFNTIRINSGAAPADINMLIAKNSPATYAAAVSRSYTITPNGANGPATLRLHYRQVELNGNSETPTGNFNLRKGPSWTAVIPTSRNVGVVDDNWLENNAVASFSEWTFANLAPTASEGVISGRITRADGTPVEGAVVNLSGGQARKTITDAEGNYHFNNVDTDGFYTVTPGRANFSFNPFHRAFTLVGNQTEAMFTGTMLGDDLNPVDTPEYFVRQQYIDILGREPGEAGLNYWSDKILACNGDVDCTRSQRTGVAAAFFIEREFKDSAAFIHNVYKSALGRQPAYSEYSVDRRRVVGGPTLDEQKLAFAAAFVARAEFVNRYENNTTAESFVDALLANMQASGVDLGSQRDSLIGRYNTGASQTEARTFVLRDVTDSAAVRDANYNGAFVLIEYFGYLKRNPDPRGYAFWLNVLNTGDPGNYRGMVCAFITSTEYQRRFSVVVSRSNAECGQ